MLLQKNGPLAWRKLFLVLVCAWYVHMHLHDSSIRGSLVYVTWSSEFKRSNFSFLVLLFAYFIRRNFVSNYLTKLFFINSLSCLYFLFTFVIFFGRFRGFLLLWVFRVFCFLFRVPVFLFCQPLPAFVSRDKSRYPKSRYIKRMKCYT